jgi:asparagine synthase (glutamine-hydrolysing)
LPQIGARLDEEQLALQLALIHGAEQRTLFAGIDRLPPGHFARVTPEALRIVRYWQPDDAPAIRFNTDRDYSAAFRERFDRVVSAQLRATSPIASHLSGGLDSSSIAATAACLLAHQGRELLALTAVPRPQFGAAPLGKFGDEGPAAARVAARHPNMHHLRVSIEKYRCLDVIQKNYLLDDRPVFNPTNGMWINAIRDIVQQRGIQVLLVGQFGNATLSYSGLDAFAEWFRRGHWWTAARCGTALIRNGYSRPRTLIAAALRPVLPAALQSQLTRRASYLQFSLVHPTLAQQTRLRERTHSSARNSADARSSARLLFQKGELADMRTGAHAGWHIDERDPTRDRRIIEFCFGIPPEQFLVGGQTRALARRAMSDRLPNATLRCRERGQQSADWHLSLAAERTGIAYELACLQRSPIARRCLDLQRMQYLIEHWPTAGFERPEVFAPWHLALTRGLAVGHFIRHFDPDVEPLHLPPPREHFHEQLPTL